MRKLPFIMVLLVVIILSGCDLFRDVQATCPPQPTDGPITCDL